MTEMKMLQTVGKKEISKLEKIKRTTKPKEKKKVQEMTLYFWHKNTARMIWSIIEIISFQIKLVYDIRMDYESMFIDVFRRDLRGRESFKT